MVEEREKVLRELVRVKEANGLFEIPKRLPGFCSGCPHRGTDSIIKYLRKESKANDFLTIPDIGCYSMSAFTPWRESHAFNAMGHAGASADAMEGVKNKKIVLIGDGTFDHGGKNSIQEAIENNRDRITILMDNKCVAMTGHQRSLTTEYLGKDRIVANRLEPIIKGMAAGRKAYVKTINPDDRRGYIKEMKKALAGIGPTILISEKECGITKERRRRMNGVGAKSEFINIASEVCENCRECTMNTGCPGLTLVSTPYGQKVAIDMSICTEDAYCAKIEACPSFEKVIVNYAGGRPKERVEDPVLEEIPEPAKRVDFEDLYCIYTGSFGGMGGGLNTVILARAGVKQGYNRGLWIGHDKKGLAVRNGGVYSHIIFSKGRANISPVITIGGANLINGLDKLEGARGLKYSNSSTKFVSNETELPTIPMLVGEEDYPKEISLKIREVVGEPNYFGLPVSELSEFYLGSKIYSNVVMLGVAYQLGLLPLDSKNLEEAITESAKAAKKVNVKAFRFGRKLVADKEFVGRLIKNPDFLLVYNEEAWLSSRSLDEVIGEKAEILEGYHVFRSRGRKVSKSYIESMASLRKGWPLDEEALKAVAIRAYDLVRWGGFSYATTYLDLVRKTIERDLVEEGFRATKAVIRNLYKVMAIKDELWVAELLLGPEKLRRDMARYNVDPSRGDKIKYVHLNRPQLNVHLGRPLTGLIGAIKKHVPNITGGKVELITVDGDVCVRFDMDTSARSLRMIRRLKFLRRLLFKHKKEDGFRDWYIDEVLGRFLKRGYENYQLAVKALSLPLELDMPNHVKGVTGFREVIYPKIDLAKYVYAIMIKRMEESLQDRL